MMKRKDFERIAQVFRVNQPEEAGAVLIWHNLIRDMCMELHFCTPRFNEAKFRAACEKGG